MLYWAKWLPLEPLDWKVNKQNAESRERKNSRGWNNSVKSLKTKLKNNFIVLEQAYDIKEPAQHLELFQTQLESVMTETSLL